MGELTYKAPLGACNELIMLTKLKDESLRQLYSIAELSEEDANAKDADEHEMAMKALSKVLKYGTCYEAAQAIGKYTSYSYAMDTISLLG